MDQNDEVDELNFDVILLRRELGLKPIEIKEVQCRRIRERGIHKYERCEMRFSAQFLGGKQQHFFCHRCKNILTRQEIWQ